MERGIDFIILGGYSFVCFSPFIEPRYSLLERFVPVYLLSCHLKTPVIFVFAM